MSNTPSVSSTDGSPPIERLPGDSGPPCDGHECNARATLWCPKCEAAYCESCWSKAHSFSRPLRSHVKRPLTERDGCLCATHGKSIVFLCQATQRGVCVECFGALNNEQKHSCVALGPDVIAAVLAESARAAEEECGALRRALDESRSNEDRRRPCIERLAALRREMAELDAEYGAKRDALLNEIHEAERRADPAAMATAQIGALEAMMDQARGLEASSSTFVTMRALAQLHREREATQRATSTVARAAEEWESSFQLIGLPAAHERIADLHLEARSLATAPLRPGRRLAVLGGKNSSGNLATVAIYDPSADADTSPWSTNTAPMRVKRAWHAVASLGGAIYAIGGEYEGAWTTAERYDIETNTWTDIALMQAGRQSHAAASLGDRVLALGGWFTSTVEEYDPSTDRWVTGPALPVEGGNLCDSAAVSVGNAVYVMGGRDSQRHDLNCHHRLDLRTPHWQALAPMRIRRRLLAAAAPDEQTLFALGGVDGNTLPRLSTVERYDVRANRWDTVSPMRVGRDGPGAVALEGNRIMALGGWGGGFLSSVEIYDVQSDTWSDGPPLPEPRGNVAAVGL